MNAPTVDAFKDLLTKFGPSLSVTTWEMPPDLPILDAGVHLGTEKIENYLYRIIGVFLNGHYIWILQVKYADKKYF